MGTASVDHISVTPLLHVGDWAPFFHVATDDPCEAARVIGDGIDAVVPTFDVAEQTLMVIGFSEADAVALVDFASGDKI